MTVLGYNDSRTTVLGPVQHPLDRSLFHPKKKFLVFPMGLLASMDSWVSNQRYESYGTDPLDTPTLVFVLAPYP